MDHDLAKLVIATNLKMHFFEIFLKGDKTDTVPWTVAVVLRGASGDSRNGGID